MECSDEDYSDSTEERPITIPQVKPLYSSCFRGRNSSQRKPPQRIVMFEDGITEDKTLSRTLQKTDVPEDESLSVNSLSGDILPFYKGQSDKITSKGRSVDVNGKFPLSENKKEQLDKVVPHSLLKCRTPFTLKDSKLLVQNSPKTTFSNSNSNTESDDEDYSDRTEERPMTIPQFKPLYSSGYRRRNSSQRKPLQPLRCIVKLEDCNSEDEAQNGTLQKTEIPEDGRLSGGNTLPYCEGQSNKIATKGRSDANSNSMFSLSDHNKERLDMVSSLQSLKIRTPFSAKGSKSLIQRLPKPFTPSYRKTDENGMHCLRDSKQVQRSLEWFSNEKRNEKQDGLQCSGNDDNKGERVLKDILNYDHNNHINQYNSHAKKSLELKSTQDSNHGSYVAKESFVKPSVVNCEKVSVGNGLRKSPNIMPSTIEKRGVINNVQHIDENPEVHEKPNPQLFVKTKESEKQSEANVYDARLNNGMGPSVLYVNNVQYSVLSKLGSGGSSQVYQVLDRKTSSLLAVKCVNLVDADNVTAMGYIKEVEMLSKLQGSYRVIRLIDHEYLKAQQILYVVMEKGDTDLSTLLKQISKTGEVSLPMIIYYWTEMLHAVKEIHSHGIVHADLKPANFLLVCGRLKLIDFGIASAMQNDATSIFKNSMHGTCNYMSPEAIDDPGGSSRTKVGYKSDVWSLGCILYNLLYRRTPFQHITNNMKKLHVISNPNHKIEFPPVSKCPPPLMEAMRHCLIYNYKKRPTVAELLAVDYIWPMNE